MFVCFATHWLKCSGRITKRFECFKDVNFGYYFSKNKVYIQFQHSLHLIESSLVWPFLLCSSFAILNGLITLNISSPKKNKTSPSGNYWDVLLSEVVCFKRFWGFFDSLRLSLHLRFIVLFISLATSSLISTPGIGGNAWSTNPATTKKSYTLCYFVLIP